MGIKTQKESWHIRRGKMEKKVVRRIVDNTESNMAILHHRESNCELCALEGQKNIASKYLGPFPWGYYGVCEKCFQQLQSISKSRDIDIRESLNENLEKLLKEKNNMKKSEVGKGQ